MTTDFYENAVLGLATQYHWVATNIHTRNTYIVDDAAYQVNEGSLVVFLEFRDAFDRKFNPITVGVPSDLKLVRYVIQSAGGQPLPAKVVEVALGVDLSSVRIDTKGLSGAYQVTVAGRTIFFEVVQPLPRPAPVVQARPRRPPTAPTGDA